MRIWKFTLCAAALGMLFGPLADGALAQRGERGGGGGGGRGDGGGGRSFSGGRSSPGGRGGGGRSFSGGGENRGGNRSFSPGRSPGGGGDRGRASGEAQRRSFQSGQSFSRNPRQSNQPNQSRQATPQRSFYRGPDGRSPDRATLDSQRDNRGQQANHQGQPDLRQNAERQGREQFRNDRFYDEVQRRDQLSNRGRGDFDRERWDGERDRDRNQWDRDRDRDRGGNRDWNQLGRSNGRWRGNDVRNNWWRGFAGASVPFQYGWWDNYYGSSWPIYSPWRYSRWQNQPNYWWGFTPAPRLTDWFVFGWNQPRYWSYGPGRNIYYRDNYVYYDDRRTVPVNDYYQQVYDLAHSVPNISEAEAEQMDWAPLGVFVAMRQNEPDSQRAMQLAVNRDGVLTGTYMNRSNGHVHPLSGMVDERTQRAAWAFADGQQKEVVFETGIYNLTRDEASIMVHFGPSADDTEVWQLVRLEQPESSGGNAAAQSAAPQTLP